jgi:hypothetical protein
LIIDHDLLNAICPHKVTGVRMIRLATGIVLLLGISAVRADDLQTVLENYVSWRGGSAFQAMHSFHERGEVMAGGLHGTYEQWLLSDGRLRRSDLLGPLSSEQAATKDAGWRTNTSGQIEDLGEDAEPIRRGVFLAFAMHAEGYGAHYSLLGTEEREGKIWDVVRVQFTGPDTYDLLIGPGTGELLGERITEDRKTRFVHLADWRFVNGVRMPFSLDQAGSNPADNQSQHARSIQINVQASLAQFARPKEPRIWTFSSGQTSTGWIDFEYFGGTQIFIPATLNGRPTQVLLDSGAGITVIDSGYATQLKLKRSGAIAVTGVGGEGSMPLTSDLHLAIGNLSLTHITAGIIDLSDLAAQDAHPMPLILGKEAFNQLIIEIDFHNRKIAFHSPDNFSAPPDATRIALGHHNDTRTIPISVEGAPAVPFDFDLGNDGALIIYPAYRDGTHLLNGRPQSLGLMGGVGGMTKTKISSIKTITIAGTPMTDIPAEFPDAAENTVNSDRIAGNVGLAVISRFKLIADYPHDALWLTAGIQDLDKPFARNRAGLDLQPADDRLKVLLVQPGGPAEHGSWKEGEEIIAIDGKKIDAKFSGSELSHWREAAPGTVVALTLADGSVRQLTLADFY